MAAGSPRSGRNPSPRIDLTAVSGFRRQAEASAAVLIRAGRDARVGAGSAPTLWNRPKGIQDDKSSAPSFSNPASSGVRH